MIVSVVYYDPLTNSYNGKSYTYFCDLQVLLYQKILAPVEDGHNTVLKKAIIIEKDLPESTICDEWRHRVKTIAQLDTDE